MERRRWPLVGSIRFRLTVWCTLLLAGVLLAIGLVVAALFEEQLAEDRDRRLASTARQVVADFQPSVPATGPSRGADPFQAVDLLPPDLDQYEIPGLYLQVNNYANLVYRRSSNLGSATFPSVSWPPPPASIAFDEVEFGGQALRTVRVPIYQEDTFYGALIVGESLGGFQQTLTDLRRLLAVTSLAGVALAATGGWLLSGRALRPVDRMTQTAATMAATDRPASALDARLDVPPTGDEVARLAATFNAMLDRLQAAFETQRRFLADASHELRTPLTAIRGNVEVMLRQAGRGPSRLPPETLDALEDVRVESERMGRLLGDLLLLARSDAPGGEETMRREMVRLDLLTADAVKRARGLAAGQYLELFAPEPVTIVGDPDRLRQLVLVLVDNSLRHTRPDGQVVVEVRRFGARQDLEALLRVRDDGEGIAPEHLPRIFERFYRADGARVRSTGGTGLGLAIAKATADAHGGVIAIESQPGAGTTVTVRFPAAQVPSERQDDEPGTNVMRPA